MADVFLKLLAKERETILRKGESQLGRAANILEKDVWVCWVLGKLFAMPGRKKMVFKGGTSLSKAFGAIQRFSEDVDVTIDYRELDTSVSPFGEKPPSRSQLDRYTDKLRKELKEYVGGRVVPYFELLLKQEFPSGDTSVKVEGENVFIHYPSALGEKASGYIPRHILIEFGGRNAIEPNEDHEVHPEIAGEWKDVEFPVARATVLSPLRTFWEKATLAHVACNEGKIRGGAERYSRHWYDLTVLADHSIGKKALVDRNLLEDVVRHKKVFYASKDSRYEDCLEGKFRIIPGEELLVELRKDFERMRSAEMFFVTPPSFEEITARLRKLEEAINGG
ncbi:MAG: nucleotidyl transferase AbiEii/AbiGii toxin family protein [Bdellovibrionota bacterium]